MVYKNYHEYMIIDVTFGNVYIFKEEMIIGH